MRLCGFDVGLDKRFFLIAGTCSIESLEMSLQVAGQLKEICMASTLALMVEFVNLALPLPAETKRR
jgi:2-dehydro-3-deoxyphosphooctonate aldolase (KDO 8-P synthase)